MHQDIAHYYLVSYTERAVPLEKKMIFRTFKEIETLIQRIHCKVSVERVDCADFNQPSKPFEEWRRKASKEVDPENHDGLTNEQCFSEPHNEPVLRQPPLGREMSQVEKINALEGLKTS
jgi:hypothetical protein